MWVYEILINSGKIGKHIWDIILKLITSYLSHYIFEINFKADKQVIYLFIFPPVVFALKKNEELKRN